MVRVKPEVRVEAQGVGCPVAHDEGRVAACIPFRLQNLIQRVQRNLEIALRRGEVGIGPEIFADLITVERRLMIREKQLKKLTGFLTTPAIRWNRFASAPDLKTAQRFDGESKPGVNPDIVQAKRIQQAVDETAFPSILFRMQKQRNEHALIRRTEQRGAGKEE